MPTVYLFRAGDYVKVGHTSDLEERLFQLLWGVRPSYLRIPNGAGEVLARRDFDSLEEAKLTERLCQDALAEHAVSKNTRGGRCEWFAVSPEEAISALEQACEGEFMTIELPARAKRKLERIKREEGHVSIHAAAASVLRRGLHMI